MSNPIKGMLAIISDYGVGKTTFALECGYAPEDIIFINDDVKRTGFETDFKQHIDLVAQSKGLKVLEFHEHCNKMIQSLPESKVIIWDTWTQYQASFPAYVKANPNEFRNPNEYSAMGRIKAGEQYQDAYRYEGAALSALKEKCDLLILTFHLKSLYIDGSIVPGKFIPGHDRAIMKYADLRIWLTQNVSSQVPVGLVLKNISKRHLTDRGIKTEQVLPLRLPFCNWESIWSYYDDPIGNRKPKESERPNSFELSLIEGTLTLEDKRLYEANLSLAEQKEAQEKAAQLMAMKNQEQAIREYIAENLSNLPNPLKMSRLNKVIESGTLEYNGEITLAKIADWS